MADKSPKLEDFNGLTIKQLTAKIETVTSLEFLSELEEKEKAGENRVGALSAINERQGILLDEQVNETPDTSKEAATIADDEQPVGPKGEQGTIEIEEEKSEEELEAEKVQGDLFETAIDKIREQRMELDRILILGMNHRSVGEDFEDQIFLAKGWLGKLLGVLGAKNPYHVEGGVKAVNQIPPTAEVDHSLEFVKERNAFSIKSGLEALQLLRDRIEDVVVSIDSLELLDLDLGPQGRVAHVYRTQAQVYATNAKLFLGRDLSKMRG